MSPTISAERFVRAAGYTDELRSLFHGVKSKWARDLIGIATLVHQETPAFAEEVGFSKAYRVVKNAPPKIQDRILSYPAIGYWLAVAQDLLIRQAHMSYPELHVRTHFQSFGRFALSAAILSEIDANLTVRLDDQWRLSLAGLGIVLQFRRDVPLIVECQVRDTCVTFSSRGQHIGTAVINDLESDGSPAITGEIRAYKLPRASSFLELNWADKDLWLVGKLENFIPELTESGTDQWMQMLDRSIHIIDAVDPLLSAEIRAALSIVVPVESPDSNRHLSASAEEIWGAIHMSWSPLVEVIVEALVHEYLHNKLSALLLVDPLIVGPTREAIYYSPWRPDPRPLSGILHGVFVFQGITAFWYDCLRTPMEKLSGDVVIKALHLRHSQVLRGVAELKAHAECTDLGLELLETIEDRMRSIELPHLPDATRELLSQQLNSHETSWQAHYTRGHDIEDMGDEDPLGLDDTWKKVGGSVRITGRQQRERLHGGEPQIHIRKQARIEKAETSTELWKQLEGVLSTQVRAVDTSGLDAGLGTDYLLQMITELALSSPDNVLEAKRVLEVALADTIDELAVLLYGHIGYTTNQFDQAAAVYDWLLARCADRLSLWTMYGFALGHLGFWSGSRVALFEPELCAYYARRYAIGEEIAQLPALTYIKRSTLESDPSARLILLQWLGRALNRGGQ
jgi:HEXXH motif-containing protein